MVALRWFILSLLLSAVISKSLDQGSGLGSIVSSLAKFQAENGGFRPQQGEEPSLEATSDALFLASLFGLSHHKINVEGVSKFLQTLANSDDGYGKIPSSASDVESVRQTVLSYKHLGLPVPNAAGLIGFIQKLLNPQGLYNSSVSEKGNLRSTAFALQTLALLDAQKNIKQETKAKLNNYLKSIAKEAGDQKYFTTDGTSSVSENYYGVAVASYIGFDFGDLTKWVNFIAAAQSPNGQFYTDLNKKKITLEASLHSVAALHNLQRLSKGKNLFERINVDSLYHSVKSAGRDLRSTAQAGLAVTLSKGFASQFHTAVSYPGVDGHVFVEGTQVTPVVAVHSLDGIPHPGLHVEVTIQHLGESKVVKLVWKEDEQHYVAETAYPATKLGLISFQYTIRLALVEFGELAHTVTDERSIGYGVKVAASAQLAGKEYEEGEAIGIGTEFTFGLTLFSQSVDNINSGDFDVRFTVLDSSHKEIHTQTIDGRQNKKPFTFSFGLKNPAIPAGEIVALFEVSSKQGVHTTKSLAYNFAVPMIATQITFEKFARSDAPKYKIGDSVVVTVIPASFPDLRSVYHYTGNSANLKQYQFFLDISTPQGTVKHSVAGVPKLADGKAVYVFTHPIAASLEEVGVNVVSFRYRAFNGHDFPLSNYDSVLEELYDETTLLNYTVNAELHVIDVVEKPGKDDFFYGNDIVFKFKVRDSVSGKNVVANAPEKANVFLSLKHTQTGKARAFTSVNQPAQIFDVQGKPAGFRTEWTITPNAVRGSGFLTLTVQDADGSVIPLYKENNKEEIQFSANIGGEISIVSNTLAYAPADAKEAVFLAQFQLLCNGKKLKDAHLRTSVVYRASKEDAGVELFALPVATNDEGNYEASWALPRQKAKSGDYHLRFLREVDRHQANSEEASKPLFEITIHHEASNASNFPIRSEFFASLLLGLVFFWVNSKKANYNKL